MQFEFRPTDIWKRLRTAKRTFALVFAGFVAAYVYFMFLVGQTGLALPLAIFLGVLSAVWYLFGAALAAVLWTLAVQLRLGLRDLARLIKNVMDEAAAGLRQRYPDGVVIDVDQVDQQVEGALALYSERFEQQGEHFAFFYQVGPQWAGKGARYAAHRIADQVPPGETLTPESFARMANVWADRLALGALRRMLLTAALALTAATVAWAGLPLLAAYLAVR
jgi:hypothetical protein